MSEQNIINYVPPTWDEFFMLHVYLVASKSKDPSTKIGAVIVRDNTVISEGYNGFCRKVNDNIAERWNRPEKYAWIEHGERNSIFNAARNGIKTLDGVMFTQEVPCVDCGRSVIQAGIKEIVLHKQWSDIWKQIMQDKWKGAAEITLTMFKEAGINVRWLDKQLNVQSLISERLFVV